MDAPGATVAQAHLKGGPGSDATTTRPRRVLGALFQRYSDHDYAKRWSLAFGDADLEREYGADRSEAYVPLLRLAALFALVLYGSYLTLDWFSFRRLVQPNTYLLVFGLSFPSLLLALAATYFSVLRTWLDTVVLAALMVNATSIVTVIALGTARGVTVPSEILILFTLYIFFLFGALFRTALPLAVITAAAYVLSNAAAGMPGPALTDRSFFLVAAVILGAIACRLLEITDRRAWLQSRLLRELSERDPLTALYNYRVFFEHCEALLRQARREGKHLAVALVDVDHFKAFNDAHGHLAGDEALCSLADVMNRWARRPLDVVARLGGEEFAVLWYDAALDWAEKRANDLRQAIQATKATPSATPTRPLTVSIGLCLSGRTGGADDLVNLADRALYRAKAAGRNCVKTALQS